MEVSLLGSLGLPLVGSFAASAADQCTDCGAHVAAQSAVVASPPSLVGKATAVEEAEVTQTEEERDLARSMRRPLPIERPEDQFSVVSFNMLLKGFDRKPYYPGVGSELRAWPWRKRQFVDLLFGLDADIFCMQEVEAATFLEEFAFLSEGGYAWVAPKDDSKGKIPEIAKTAIFFKASTFEKVWEEHRSRVVLAALRHLPSKRMVYVASCHLEGAPWQGGTRFTQAKNTLESMRRQMLKAQKESGQSVDDSAVIFAGDFNETDSSAVCSFLRTGQLPATFRNPGYPDDEVIKTDAAHDFAFRDLYASCDSCRPPTFCAPPDDNLEWGVNALFSAVDFVFYSHGCLRPVALREPFTAAQVAATTGKGIPSAWHFSDHVPIGGVFEFGAENGDSNVKVV